MRDFDFAGKTVLITGARRSQPLPSHRRGAARSLNYVRPSLCVSMAFDTVETSWSIDTRALWLDRRWRA